MARKMRDWLSAMPGHYMSRMRSELWEVSVSRRIRLPIAALLNTCYGETDRYGDAALNSRPHGHRHYRCLQQWSAAAKSAYGPLYKREPNDHHFYSRNARPDGAVERTKEAPPKVHEIKVVNDVHSKHGGLHVKKPGTKCAWGNSAPELVKGIRGSRKGKKNGSVGKPPKYHNALANGYCVIAVIFNVLGGMHEEADAEFEHMAWSKGGELGEDEKASSSWASRSYKSYYGQRMSMAINMVASKQVLDAVSFGPKARNMQGGRAEENKKGKAAARGEAGGDSSSRSSTGSDSTPGSPARDCEGDRRDDSDSDYDMESDHEHEHVNLNTIQNGALSAGM